MIEKIVERIENYTPTDEKDGFKFENIVKNRNLISQNHIDNINELPKQEWEEEKEFTHWDEQGRIQTYFLCYVDLIGAAVDQTMKSYFGDIKNVFGTVMTTKKGLSYTKKKCPTKPFHSDCLQIALYQKVLPNHIPFLTYASDYDRQLFTPDNCEELQKDNLEKYYNELVLYQRCWEKKLEFANGDPKVLALLCKPDFSEIRKNGFWWKGFPKEITQRFRGYYE